MQFLEWFSAKLGFPLLHLLLSSRNPLHACIMNFGKHSHNAHIPESVYGIIEDLAVVIDKYV